MLINVNSRIYKTKINVKIQLKINITHVLIMRIFLVSGKIKTNKKADSGNKLSPKFGPSMKRNPSESIAPNPPDFRGQGWDKSQLI